MNGRALMAEALGTALLLATIVGSGIMGDHLSGGNVAIALLANSLATGAALVVLITVLGPISGAHFNPAVTLSMILAGKMPLKALPTYAVAQVLGAVLGVWVAHAMFDLSVFQMSLKIRTGSGQWISEAVATFGLLLTIWGGSSFAPKAIPSLVGAYIVAAYWFTASTSFANPAVTLARALTDSFAGIAPQDVAIFVFVQLGVAIAATPVMQGLFAKEQ